MKTILIVTLLAIGSLNAYEPFNYNQWSRDYMKDIDNQFNRMENSFNQGEQNRLLRELLIEKQGAWRYGR